MRELLLKSSLTKGRVYENLIFEIGLLGWEAFKIAPGNYMGRMVGNRIVTES